MAAGLGFKDFVTGEVLTAADVDGYLMQGIWVFASAAARDAAVTSPQEGNACYLKDTDAIMTYSGSAWVSASAPTSYGFAAGKNKIINGDMNIWQRGTSTTLTNNTTAFGPDRFIVYTSFSAGTSSFSRQTFTPGTAPVAGYESAYFARLTCGSTSTYFEIDQNVEDVRTLAGQTVTLSFWAKASGTVVITPTLNQVFGSGGSGSVSTTGSNQTLTTSWARYSVSVSLPSISGKTIGTSSYLNVALVYASGTINSATIDVWGVQLEAGSTATAFQTATGTIQGELAACQRYFVRTQDGSIYITQVIGMGSYFTSSQVDVIVNLPVRMRVIPTFSAPTGTDYYRISRNGADDSFNSLTLNSQNGPLACALYNNAQVSGTAGQVGMTQINNTSAYLDFSAEL